MSKKVLNEQSLSTAVYYNIKEGNLIVTEIKKRESVNVTSLHRYIVTLLHRYIVTLLHRYIVTLVHRYIVTSLHRYIVTSLHCYIGTSLSSTSKIHIEKPGKPKQ